MELTTRPSREEVPVLYALTRIREPEKHDSPGSISRFNNLPLPAGAGGAPAGSNTPREAWSPYLTTSPSPQKRCPEPQIPLESYKLYYVN
jgi:hypothetical protein